MARFRRFRRYTGRVYRRARRFGGWKRSFGRGRFGVNLSTPFLIGAAIGMTDLDQMIPAPVKILAACAPVRGLGPIKAAAQGMLVGDVVQSLTGFTLPIVGGLGGSSSGGNVI